jgi:ABC-type transport system involved in multi-copper enzyme maturation permease subunit
MGEKQIIGNMGSIITGLIVVFLGFILVIVLMAQASVVNATTGQVTLANSGIFFGMIFLSLLCVLLGGYLIGKYAEKARKEKQSVFSPPPP